MSTEYAEAEVPPITVGMRLRIAREWRGLQQSELALKARVARNTISNYENDQTTRINPLYLESLANALRVPVAWLETGEAGPTSGPGLTSVAGTGFEPVTSGLLVRFPNRTYWTPTREAA